MLYPFEEWGNGLARSNIPVITKANTDLAMEVDKDDRPIHRLVEILPTLMCAYCRKIN